MDVMTRTERVEAEAVESEVAVDAEVQANDVVKRVRVRNAPRRKAVAAVEAEVLARVEVERKEKQRRKNQKGKKKSSSKSSSSSS
mmetsp:Transcript_115485/g.182607  ORF Transcript_115485/g.182607 Transcript_115485/m.182607 type:complete len:85 (+) Transcript_115485:358-612(+)